jgi:hypothetical protein
MLQCFLWLQASFVLCEGVQMQGRGGGSKGCSLLGYVLQLKPKEACVRAFVTTVSLRSLPFYRQHCRQQGLNLHCNIFMPLMPNAINGHDETMSLFNMHHKQAIFLARQLIAPTWLRNAITDDMWLLHPCLGLFAPTLHSSGAAAPELLAPTLQATD